MSLISIEPIAQRVSALFGLPVLGVNEEFDGGHWGIIRPTEPAHPRGFGIVIQDTLARTEAYLITDDFAGAMVRQLGESEADEFDNFNRIRTDLEATGKEIVFAVNEDQIRTLNEIHKTQIWRRIYLSCSLRFPMGRKPDEALANEYATNVVSACMELLLELLPVTVEEPLETDIPGLPEGSHSRTEVNKYVRSPRNRYACIKHHGAICKVCGLDFGESYGDIGKGFIEVHHLLPVSQMGGSYKLDPVKDLVPLCSNCHSMAHKDRHQQTPRSVEELKGLMNQPLGSP